MAGLQSGFVSGAQAAQEMQTQQMEAQLQQGQLGLSLHKLDLDRQKMQQDIATKATETAQANFVSMTGIVKQMAERMGTIPRTSQIFDAYLMSAKNLAKAFKNSGGNPDDAMSMYDTVVAAASDPNGGLRKDLPAMSPGSQVPQVQPDGSIKMTAAVPPNPQVVPGGAALVQTTPGVAGAPTTTNKTFEQPPNPNANQPRYTSHELVFDKDGKQKGYRTLESTTGQMKYFDMNGQTFTPETGDTINTPSSQQIAAPTAENLHKLQNDVLVDGQGIDSLQKLLDRVKTGDSGAKVTVNQFTAGVKTFFDKAINDKEFNTAMQKGDLAQALGSLRVQVLGPGTMTQADKEFLVSAVGGDVNALRNPKVVEALIQPMIERKMQIYEANRSILAGHADRFPALKIKVPAAKDTGTTPAATRGAINQIDTGNGAPGGTGVPRYQIKNGQLVPVQ